MGGVGVGPSTDADVIKEERREKDSFNRKPAQV